MSSRSVVASTLRNYNVNKSSFQTGQPVRNRPSDPSRFLSPNFDHKPHLNTRSSTSLSLRSTRPLNSNRNPNSYSKSIHNSRDFSTPSLYSASSSASNGSRNKTSYSKYIQDGRDCLTPSLHSAASNSNRNKTSYHKSIYNSQDFSTPLHSSASSNIHNKVSYSKSIDVCRNFSTSSLDSSSGASDYTRNKTPFSKSTDNSRNFLTPSLDSSSGASDDTRNKTPFSKSTDNSRNFSTSSLDSSASSASCNSDNDTLFQFSTNSGASSTTSFQSSVPSSPGRNLADFDILKLLGTGGTSRVYLVRDKRTGNLVALKVISKTGRNKVQLNDVINEQTVHRLVSDPADEFILPILGSWHDESNFFIITEYIPGSDLAVETMKSRKLGEEKVRFYAAELVVALDSLHKKNVIHRDFKLGNILLDADGHVRLCDYGSAIAFDKPTVWREKQESVPAYVSFDVDGSCDSGAFLKPSMEPVYLTNGICGTPYFMSPEQHRGKDYSFDVDLWGLGVSIFRMLTGRMPFGDHVLHKEDVGACVMKEPLVFRPSDDVPPVTRSLLEGLLAKRPRDRLSMAEIKVHPYFQDINWEQVAKRGLSCPSKPYLSPVPKHPKELSPTLPGVLYSPREDPFPLFHYTSEELDRPLQSSWSPQSPTPTEESIKPESKPNIFKNVGKFFKSLVRKSDMQSPPSRQNPRALRPLILPSIVSGELPLSPSPSPSPPSPSPSPPLSPPPGVHPTGESYALPSSHLSDTELVPPRPRRHLPAFAGSGYRSPPSLPLSRACSYVPRKASPLQKSHSLPLPPSPSVKSPRPCSMEEEKANSVSSLRANTDPLPRSNALGRFKGWAQRLSSVSEDSRAGNGSGKERQRTAVAGHDDDDDDDDDEWDFRCRGDPDEQLMQCTVSEKRW